MPTPVLATKLFAPTRRLPTVPRPRLAERLDATLDAGQRLTLVSAPAGFGKTTVVSEWATGVAGRRTTGVGWLSLDDGDNDLARFLTHAVAALQGAGLELDDTVLEPAMASSNAVLAAIINDVARAAASQSGKQWLLVLDDYHVIEAPGVHESVAFLIDHLPAQLHLLMTTRSDPPLPVARLRGRAQLTELRAADLRFTATESAEFLNRVMGLDLTVADVEVLEERTEGWIAGLQLAALSLRGVTERTEVARFIDAFAGSNRFVIDYLADEVLTRQPERVRSFLLRTAVLDRLTGALCEAVTGRADGARTLERLERDNLFLVSLDDERAWYRYHHLFADVLRARLLAEHPDEVPRLHRRACTWFAAHDLVADAVRHALAADDFARAAYLVEEALPGLRRGRQDSLLLSWMRELPADALPRHTAAAAYLHEGDGDPVTARLYAEAARSAPNLPERDHLTRQVARLNAQLRS